MRTRSLLCFLGLVVLAASAAAQDPTTFPLTSICVVRADPEGDCRGAANLEVCVEGVVLAWKQFGTRGPGAIWDPVTGCGIGIYDITTAPDLVPGTIVRVCGWSGPFSGLDELVDDPVDGTPDPVVTVLGSGGATPVNDVTGADLANNSPTAEGLESELVRVCGTFTGAFPAAGASGNVPLLDSYGNTCTIRIDSDTDIDGTTAPTGNVTVIGVLQQYDAGVACTGYQLLPRSLADIASVADCATVGVDRAQWSSIKVLYR